MIRWFLISIVLSGAIAGCHREPNYEGRAIAAWYDALQSNSPAERRRAAQIIAQSAADHPESADALLRALTLEADSTVHATLAEAIGRLTTTTTAVAPALERLMGDSHPSVRIAAIQALGSLAMRSPAERGGYVAALAAKLRDADHDVRLAAAASLKTAIADDMQAAIVAYPELRRVALHDPLSSVREEVVGIVAALPLPDSAFVSVLGSTLSARSTSTQLAALDWMVRHRHAVSQFSGSVRELIRSDDYRVRAKAQLVLGDTGR